MRLSLIAAIDSLPAHSSMEQEAINKNLQEGTAKPSAADYFTGWVCDQISHNSNSL